MDGGLRVAVWILAVAAVLAGAYHASTAVAPLALALFVIALVWPLQHRLQARIPGLLALAITVLITAAVGLAFASLVAWAFGRVVRHLAADAGRYQALYSTLVTWLDGHGISVAGLLAEHFNVAWLLGLAQQITGRINTALTFCVVALAYLLLGLLEVDLLRRKLQAWSTNAAARLVLQGATAAKLRRYMWTRTQMSVRRLHRRSHHHCRPDLLRAASFEPLGREPARRGVFGNDHARTKAWRVMAIEEPPSRSTSAARRTA